MSHRSCLICVSEWTAVNTDGSVIPELGISTAGGVIRGSDGRFIKAFAVNLGGGSITHVELAGIAQGLGARRVRLQTDSAVAISLLQSDQAVNPHHTMISLIRQLVARDWEVSIEHVFREAIMLRIIWPLLVIPYLSECTCLTLWGRL
ncbi:unnamed protein product [Linum trigynum]|uniref:RNase H type-1 domain-containing protein n=1 Tax=Linum trigynum TaxID=586398 RepID=A0AAV2FGA9_9ROSI